MPTSSNSADRLTDLREFGTDPRVVACGHLYSKELSEERAAHRRAARQYPVGGGL